MKHTHRNYDADGYQRSSLETVESHSVSRLRSAAGEVIYAVRLPDGTIKIGWTADLGSRMTKFGATAEVMALKYGTLADELAIHASLADHRAHGHEYYHAVPEVLAVVNDMRADLGLEPLAA